LAPSEANQSRPPPAAASYHVFVTADGDQRKKAIRVPCELSASVGSSRRPLPSSAAGIFQWVGAVRVSMVGPPEWGHTTATPAGRIGVRKIATDIISYGPRSGLVSALNVVPPSEISFTPSPTTPACCCCQGERTAADRPTTSGWSCYGGKGRGRHRDKAPGRALNAETSCSFGTKMRWTASI